MQQQPKQRRRFPGWSVIRERRLGEECLGYLVSLTWYEGLFVGIPRSPPQ